MLGCLHASNARGTGGQSSVSGIIATVFGATGFLGRYLVQQLAKMGSQVLVPFRGSEDNPRHLKLMGDLGQIVPMKYDPRDENSIKAVIAKANVVINLIGREYETRNFNFEEVNHFMADQLAVINSSIWAKCYSSPCFGQRCGVRSRRK
ncbi:hypothetical protein ES332_A13G089400v1 [Gossypium tomentosum]|uniref:NAD-dependent epimerase/dehydratase domain-containing protein n=1 Tax=Gossypium tomentosum TaxID=34277 RepID=A0A5D2MJS2_GOSTO|nr:hypothetical protein ES332_A13G089400v1 [Gossypium tomentosum]